MFSPICGLSFHYMNSVLQEKFLILMKSKLIFSFINHGFGVTSKELLSNQGHIDFLMFFPRSWVLQYYLLKILKIKTKVFSLHADIYHFLWLLLYCVDHLGSFSSWRTLTFLEMHFCWWILLDFVCLEKYFAFIFEWCFWWI